MVTEFISRSMHGVVVVLSVLLVFSCNGGRSKTVEVESDPGVDEILAEMEADTALIAFMDSLAGANIGPGAKCIHTTRHLYTCDGRNYLYGEAWGDVIELPDGWIPAIDRWQAAVTFHGTHVWSPDTLILVRTYGAFECDLEYEEYRDDVVTSLENNGVVISSKDEFGLDLGNGFVAKTFTIEGRNQDGINYRGKYIWRDANSVCHSASVQWDDTSAENVQEMLSYLDRFPLAPNGVQPRAIAI